MVLIYSVTLLIGTAYFATAFLVHCIHYDEQLRLAKHYQALVNQLAGTKSAELRKRATSQGITWRNVHGKNRHMKVNELRAALFIQELTIVTTNSN